MIKQLKILFPAILFSLAFPSQALAYLDPGTGSMLVSALVGLAATLFFLLKSSWYKLLSLSYRLLGQSPPQSPGGLVFYSEGRQYWTTFQPVLEELEARGEAVLYLSSDEQDPGLRRAWRHISTRCLGMGNRGFAALNMLEAEICVMTTPGLDVLQIRRSPGVKHYAHLVHAVTDMAYYKLYAFDYFDSVLCAGPHQLASLRHLEEIRGLPPKQLLETGCCYMDALAEELDNSGTSATTPRTPASFSSRRLLIAPTWGNNGLFNRFGLDLILPLLEAGHSLCLRPHPQSFISEKPLLDKLRMALEGKNVCWDERPGPLEAMLEADALISDLSGIVFDYAFILERPAITVDFEPDPRGKEAADLPWKAWELEVLPDLGGRIRPEDIASLPEILAALPDPREFAARMRALREKSLFNFRRSGAVAADQLLELRQRLPEEEGHANGRATPSPRAIHPNYRKPFHAVFISE